MRRLVIVGAGGHGVVVGEAAVRCGRWSEIVFLDDDYPERRQILSWEIIGKAIDFLDWIESTSDFHVAIGCNDLRLKLHRAVQEARGQTATVVDPSAIVSTSATLGLGCVVLANAVINARSQLGEAVIVNTAATVDHDCELADGVHICPGAHLAGNVTVGWRACVGMGATVKQSTLIEEDAVVGASAAVIRGVAARQTVVGIPARPLQR